MSSVPMYSRCWNGLVILKDTVEFSSERLWASLILRAVEENKGPVRVYLLTSYKDKLMKCLPLMERCSSVAETGSLEEVLIQESSLAQKSRSSLFLDSVDTFFVEGRLDQTIALLLKISSYALLTARIHDECISKENWDRLSSVCQITYSLKLSSTMIPMCTTVFYKKSGKRSVKMEEMQIDESLRVCLKPYKSENATAGVPENSLLVPESSFDLGLDLKKSELEAKQNVPLPFLAIQKQEAVVELCGIRNRKVRAGGRIIYEPDKADDFDESDPDDDLEI